DTQAHDIYSRIGHENGQANALYGLGEVYRDQSKYDQAAFIYSEAQKIYTRIGNGKGKADASYGLGAVYHQQSKYEQAVSIYSEAQRLYARIGNDKCRADALYGLAAGYHHQSKDDQAGWSYNEAEELYARVGHGVGQANALYRLGELYRCIYGTPGPCGVIKRKKSTSAPAITSANGGRARPCRCSARFHNPSQEFKELSPMNENFTYTDDQPFSTNSGNLTQQ
ncbi:hypothetical protein FRC00_008045, partial [Tulasnella sp. 408]